MVSGSQCLDCQPMAVSINTASTAVTTRVSNNNNNNTELSIDLSTCYTQLEMNGDRECINNQSHKDEGESCPTSRMPPGWTRVARQRRSGKTAGKIDVYITR